MPSPRSRKSKATGKPVKPRPAKADNTPEALLGSIGIGELQRLIRLVQKTGIGELEVKSGARAVRISANAGASVQATPGWSVQAGEAPGVGRSGAAGTEPPAAPVRAETTVAITSPMVGTFYRAPAPDADPYLETGDRVELGQTVCIIEAMKLMNEIESEVKGRVVEILIDNAQPVEFGQKLFLVQPD